MKELTLAEAVDQIRRTSEGHHWPFFFMVGAGISCPSVPTAAEIVAECRRRYSRSQPPAGLSPMKEYSWWLEQAFPSPGDRQDYFEELIGGKPVTQANLRLAHLLLDGKISKLVVTTNFDDFVARALDLFGSPYVRCDHPATIQRIDPAAEKVQIVHLHGSYWFYDCCNLEGEVAPRAEQSQVSTFSMRQFLEGLLNARSPLVVGYSGWDKDVFMSALRRRLATSLRYHVYWFCYRRSEMDSLPQELRDHPNVAFVIPPELPSTEDAGAKWLEGRRVMPSGAATKEPSDGRKQPVLQATDVFQEMIQALGLEAPAVTRDPLAFYADYLSNSLPREDTYLLQSVVVQIKRAAALLAQSKQKVDKALEKVEDAIRRSQYQQAIRAADQIDLAELEPERLGGLLRSLWTAALGLLDNSPEELRAYERVVDGVDALARSGPVDEETRLLQAEALLYKGITLGQLGRNKEAIAVYDGLVERFGQDTEPDMREGVATALRNKGIELGQLGRSGEEIAVYDAVVERFGQDTEPGVREQVATALRCKGITLGQLGRSQEAIAVYDGLVERFGQDTEPGVCVQVAMALLNKSITLGQLSRNEEKIAVYDAVVERFGQDTEPGVREQVAVALFNKGITLGQLGRNVEEIAVYDAVVERFGQETEPGMRERVAKALFNKGVALGQLGHNDEEIAVYSGLVERFGQDTEPGVRERVAKALRNKGVALGRLDRNEEEIAVLDALLERFGQDSEPGVREQVAKALLSKGVALRRLGRNEEEIAVLDTVLERFGQDSEPGVREQVAKALFNKGVALGRLGRNEDAIAAFRSIVERFGQAAEPTVQDMVAKAAQRISEQAAGDSESAVADPGPAA